MATNTDATIFAALVAHLQGITFSPALPIAGPNVLFPQAGQPTPTKYLRLAFLPNRPRPYPIADDPEPRQGILQVSVIWPKGVGIIDPLNVAGQIIERFKNKTLFASGVKITISSEPWAAGPLIEDASVQVPVTIPYIGFI
ncbi:hypothetical protein HGP14_09650 [Rhizobium sp. P32RR-XVIII]|uniref:phage tail terminator-like protein n=1 Tax=Rhizobium sp. P32RR-XVIII TaxID=2726738 RepID=UPI0014569C2A|nr:phage tail terminator-like protein [Rhizobium sp. P32RR-XVIII]NLS03622.1 hypothetical protein [Rhizobium sp. P32RR-XVIII]